MYKRQLQLLKALKHSGRKLSELADEVTVYPQVLKNARIKNENKKKYSSDPVIAEEINRVEELMAGEGRVLTVSYTHLDVYKRQVLIFY